MVLEEGLLRLLELTLGHGDVTEAVLRVDPVGMGVEQLPIVALGALPISLLPSLGRAGHQHQRIGRLCRQVVLDDPVRLLGVAVGLGQGEADQELLTLGQVVEVYFPEILDDLVAALLVPRAVEQECLCRGEFRIVLEGRLQSLGRRLVVRLHERFEAHLELGARFLRVARPITLSGSSQHREGEPG